MGHACWGSGVCETLETGVIGVVELVRVFEGSLVENGECGSWEVVVEKAEVWKRGGNLFWINVEKNELFIGF